MRHAKMTLALAACGIALSLFTAIAQSAATDAKVNCNSPGAIGKITNVLSRLNPSDTNVVHVSGHCVENLVIRGFDQLTLLAEHGAVIEGARGVDLPVIGIYNSQGVEVQGFIVQGGTTGLLCTEFSSCRFTGDTVQGTKSGAGLFNAAITVDGSDVLLTNIVVRDVVDLGIALYGARAVTNNVSINGVRGVNGFLGGAGLFITAGSLRNGPIVIQNTDATGLLANNGSALDVSALTVTDTGLKSSGFPVGVNIGTGAVGNFGQLTVQRSKWAGILAQAAGTLSIYGGGMISDNLGPGIFLQWGSRFINFANTTVTTNQQFGLLVQDLSLAVLGGGVFGGNFGTDISCDGPPPGTVLLFANLGSYSTDCTFPAASAKVPKGLTFPTPPVSPPQ